MCWLGTESFQMEAVHLSSLAMRRATTCRRRDSEDKRKGSKKEGRRRHLDLFQGDLGLIVVQAHRVCIQTAGSGEVHLC